MSLFPKFVAGVDIGHSSLKVVGLKLGKKPVFVGCKEVAMDPQFLKKEGFSQPEVIGKALREAMKAAAPGAIPDNSLIYSAVSESLVFRKIIDLPATVRDDELEQAISFEASQFLPDTVDNMQLDYQVLGLNEETKGKQVMLVAISKKVVNDYLAVFAAAKLQVRAIDTKPAALARAVIEGKEWDEDIILVDVGSEVSTISLFDAGIVRVTGIVNLGGNVIRSETMELLPEDEQAVTVKRLAVALADEIDHVIKFYANRTTHPKKVQQVRITGGGSMIPGLIDVLKKEIDIDMKPGDSTIKLPPFCDRRFLGALGSALYPLYDAL